MHIYLQTMHSTPGGHDKSDSMTVLTLHPTIIAVNEMITEYERRKKKGIGVAKRAILQPENKQRKHCAHV